MKMNKNKIAKNNLGLALTQREDSPEFINQNVHHTRRNHI